MNATNNQMAVTSTTNGRVFELEVLRIFEKNGYSGTPKSVVSGLIAPDGRKVVPDLVLSKDGVLSLVECKYNGPALGTTHEKWMYGMFKLSYACNQLGCCGVIVIKDDSGKLNGHVQYLKTMAPDNVRVIRVEDMV